MRMREKILHIWPFNSVAKTISLLEVTTTQVISSSVQLQFGQNGRRLPLIRECKLKQPHWQVCPTEVWKGIT